MPDLAAAAARERGHQQPRPPCRGSPSSCWSWRMRGGGRARGGGDRPRAALAPALARARRRAPDRVPGLVAAHGRRAATHRRSRSPRAKRHTRWPPGSVRCSTVAEASVDAHRTPRPTGRRGDGRRLLGRASKAATLRAAKPCGPSSNTGRQTATAGPAAWCGASSRHESHSNSQSGEAGARWRRLPPEPATGGRIRFAGRRRSRARPTLCRAESAEQARWRVRNSVLVLEAVPQAGAGASQTMRAEVGRHVLHPHLAHGPDVALDDEGRRPA